MKIENNCLVIDINDLWEGLPTEKKAEFLQEAGAWEIIQEELLYLQGRSLSTPNFNSSIHEIRELILTNSEFVDDMLVSFVKTCLEEWAKEKQRCYAAERAYWKLYHLLDWDTHRETKHQAASGWDLVKHENNDSWSSHPSINREDVKDEILKAFSEIVRNFSPEI